MEAGRVAFVVSCALYVSQSKDVGGARDGFSLVSSAAFLGTLNTHSFIPLSLNGRSRPDAKDVDRVANFQESKNSVGKAVFGAVSRCLF